MALPFFQEGYIDDTQKPTYEDLIWTTRTTSLPKSIKSTACGDIGKLLSLNVFQPCFMITILYGALKILTASDLPCLSRKVSHPKHVEIFEKYLKAGV